MRWRHPGKGRAARVHGSPAPQPEIRLASSLTTAGPGVRPPGELAVHHPDREPEEDLLGPRSEAAVGSGRDEETRQSRLCTEIESAQLGAHLRIDAQRGKAFPDLH